VRLLRAHTAPAGVDRSLNATVPVAGILGGPRPGRVCAHLEQMRSAGAMLDCDQDLDPPEHDSVHGHEVHGEDGLGLGGKELAPGWTRSRWGGIKCRRRAESATPWRQRCDHLDARIG